MMHVQGLAMKSTELQDSSLLGGLGPDTGKINCDGSTASTCDNSDASGISSGSEFESPVAERNAKVSDSSDWSVRASNESFHPEEKQSLRTFGKKHAHASFDFDVIWACCELLNIADLVDSDFISGCMEMLSMLHRCEYTVDVTVTTLAVAVSYGEDGYIRRAFDDGSTRALIRFCMHVFLAHTYLVDEPCFLPTWHSYIFRNLCDIDDLNRELLGSLRRRKCGLRVEDTSADIAYQALEGALKRSGPAGLRVHGEIAQNLDDFPTCVEFQSDN